VEIKTSDMQSGNTNDIVFDLNKLISTIFSVIKKRWKLFLLFYLLLLVVTVIYNINKRKVYETTFSITNSQLSAVESKAIVESYSDIKKNSLVSKAESNLKLLEVQYLDDNSLDGHTLKIKMSLYDTTSFGSIMKDFLSYCDSRYLNEKINAKKEIFIKIKEDYKKQLEGLIEYKQKTEKENINSEYDIFRDIATIQESITRLDYELMQLKGFEISILQVTPFKIQGYSMTKSLMLAGILGILFCPFLVFFFDKILTNSKEE
jgi:hypothetical protein